MTIRLTTLAVLVVAGHASSAFSQGLERTKEYDALNNFVGKWKNTTTIHPSKGTPKQQKVEGTSEIQWTLNRYFVKDVISNKSSPMLGMMTWDRFTQKYLSWYFAGDGFFSEMHGVWDAESSTFRWTGSTGSIRRKAHHKFPKSGDIVWEYEVRNKQGDLLYKATGTKTRIREK